MKRYLPFLIVVAVAVITFGTGWMLYRAKRLPVPTATKDSGAEGIHVRGEAGALVTLEEFGDFECPPCSMMAAVIKHAEEEYGSRLRVIFRHFPLAMHARAREAALATEAAHMQHRFWEMHDLLYKEQAVWTKAADVQSLFNSYAGMLGLDRERFKKDMQSAEANARVNADQQLGTSRDVKSTPTIFINNTVLPPPSLNPVGLNKALSEAIKEKSKP
jgi:protein-disulfide isomerase